MSLGVPTDTLRPRSVGVLADGYQRGANAFRTDTVEVIRLETVEIRESSAGTPTLRHDESVGETPTLQPTRGETSFVGETPTLQPTRGETSFVGETPARHPAKSVGETPTLQPTAGTPSYHEALESRIRELEAELRRREAREQIQQWSLRGQLPPALAPLAEAILLQGDAPVQFSGATTSVAELFRQFVNSLPPHPLLGELAPTPETETPNFSADALEFLRRAFPDMNPAEILQQEAR